MMINCRMKRSGQLVVVVFRVYSNCGIEFLKIRKAYFTFGELLACLQRGDNNYCGNKQGCYYRNHFQQGEGIVFFYFSSHGLNPFSGTEFNSIYSRLWSGQLVMDFDEIVNVDIRVRRKIKVVAGNFLEPGFGTGEAGLQLGEVAKIYVTVSVEVAQ